jgi:glycosyltransferase involved in cell wall biosynthesis
VLSDIPTYRELWSEAAIFFDPRDPGALAEAVNRLAADAGLRAEMGARALARSRRFTPDVQARRMAELYRQLVGEPAEEA